MTPSPATKGRRRSTSSSSPERRRSWGAREGPPTRRMLKATTSRRQRRRPRRAVLHRVLGAAGRRGPSTITFPVGRPLEEGLEGLVGAGSTRPQGVTCGRPGRSCDSAPRVPCRAQTRSVRHGESGPGPHASCRSGPSPSRLRRPGHGYRRGRRSFPPTSSRSGGVRPTCRRSGQPRRCTGSKSISGRGPTRSRPTGTGSARVAGSCCPAWPQLQSSARCGRRPPVWKCRNRQKMRCR